jgi:hypothetical protein
VFGVHPLVQEANVYSVSVPHHDGRAGCVAIVLSEEPKVHVLASIAPHASKNLPRYAVPLYLRLPIEPRSTGTNKHQKNHL